MVHSKQHTHIIRLYDYQKIAFQKVVSALEETFRALVVMATGLGKTIVSIKVVKHFITPDDKVLFLCHDNGILDNAYKQYGKHFGDEYTHAKFYGGSKDWEADKHHFVFATFQSILAHLRNGNGKEKLFSPNHFKFLVVDESHHAQAETFAEVINYFTPVYKLGMTATPDREDDANIRDIFGEEMISISLSEAIAKNWLTKVDYKVLSDGLDEDKIREICKEVMEDNVRLTAKQINERIFIRVRTEEQCRIVEEYSKLQKAIVFCENIEHLRHVASILPSSTVIHSEQSPLLNASNFELFEYGHVRHVIVVDKFNEGIDVPDTELLVFLRATNSERIFLQQLGRGLRPIPGKEKVTVLDFVANVERIMQVKKLAEETEWFSEGKTRESGGTRSDARLHVEGTGFSFDFSDKTVNLLSVFEKLERKFYSTWKEASAATIVLGILRNDKEYAHKYKKDPRLPSNPPQFYDDFPGWRVFLGREKKNYCRTWQQASKIVQNLEIETMSEYYKRYKEDSRLPSNPLQFYSNFPGSSEFFGTKRSIYTTWRKASRATLKLGIKNAEEYRKRYKEDKKLPSSPNKQYTDFPGWTIFLNRKKKDFYLTWREASNAAISLGIKTQAQYFEKFKEDPCLNSSPHRFYKDFPGYGAFLCKE